MQPEESSAQVVRPKRQVHHPAYLKDYELTTVHQRQFRQTVFPHTTQHTQGLGGAAESITSPVSRESSPISQGPWDTLDEWPVAYEKEHSFQNVHDTELQPPCPSYAPVQPIHQPQPSPYHRPWEVQQSTPLPQTSYTTQEVPPMRHETVSYHQGTKLSSSMLQPTYGLRQKTVYSTAPIIRPPQNIPIMTRGSSLSLNQETVYQHLPNPAEESTIDPPTLIC